VELVWALKLPTNDVLTALQDLEDAGLIWSRPSVRIGGYRSIRKRA
jgi:hypothetical protein